MRRRRKRVREPTEQERQKIEENKRLNAAFHTKSKDLYVSHAARNEMPTLRKLTSRLRRHRYAWEQDTPESHDMRIYHASIGGTFFCVMRHRTNSWVPEGPWVVPPNAVQVTSVDIAHYFYSALLDGDGPALKEVDLREGPGKSLWHAITAACYNFDYSEIANRVVEAIGERDRTRSRRGCGINSLRD